MPSKDWWLGNTPEWQNRQDRVRNAGQATSRVGARLTLWTVGLLVTVGLTVITYGLALIVIIPAVIWWRRRRNDPKAVTVDRPTGLGSSR